MNGLTNEVAVIDHYDIMNKVAGMYHRGKTNPTVIARELGLKRAEVLDYIEEWKDIARNDVDIKAQAAEVLQSTIQYFDLLKQEAEKLLEQADDKENLVVKASTIKIMSDLGRQQFEMLQKAGLYGDASLGDELAEMEEKQQILVKILKEVSSDCDKCKFEVARRLSKVTGKVEDIAPSMVVDSEVINPAS